MKTELTFNPATPIFRVGDLDASLRFYVEQLGFRIDWRGDEDLFASVSRGRCTLFLCVGGQGHPGGWIWVGMSDVDELHAELRTKNVQIRSEPENYPWGSREMHVQDPDGNVIRFASDTT